MAFSLFFVPSTEKVFGDTREGENYCADTALSGETFSVQAAFYTDEPYIPVSLCATCETLPVTAYKIGFVPVPEETWGIRHAKGAYPDVLLPRAAAPVIVEGDRHLPFYEKNEQNVLGAGHSTAAVWLTLNECGAPMPAGEHTLTVTVTSMKTGEKLASSRFVLRVLPAELPPRDYLYSNWFHYDCLADFYGVPLWTDAYFDILASYFDDAVKCGQTMILTPAFTPALDTVIGEERRRVQLVGIRVENGAYRFDFSLLERFVKLAKKHGFRYFEHAHLFSQWGAAHAPNIYGEKDGKEVRLFGWETDAGGAEYAGFLAQYIPAFLEKAREWGVENDLYFHISDEPKAEQAESYARALAVAEPLLKGCRRGDALSDPQFYEKGLVPMPVVALRAAERFYGKCDRDWMLYHTGNPLSPGSRRLITVPNAEVRGVGLHLFRYRTVGFMHWGYNYWYDCMSHGFSDPKLDPCSYKQMEGAAFIVYPAQGGAALSSIRAVLMREAFEDYRALLLLEKLRGYGFCVSLCEKIIGGTLTADTLPANGAQLRAVRAAVNNAIEQAL